MIDIYKALFDILLPALAVGIPISYLLLKDTDLLHIEKLIIGFIIGIGLPQLFFTAAAVAGIPFSFNLIIIIYSLLFVSGICIAIDYLMKNKQKINLLEYFKPNATNFIVSIALIAIMGLCFWLRIQSLAGNYQEIDPYFYMYGTRMILTDGIIPFVDDTAWYPDAFQTHRQAPFLSFLEATWYTLYNGGTLPYDNMLLSTIANIYPAIASALLAFSAYLIVSRIYDRRIALFAGLPMLFLPILIAKMSSGIAEIQPYGLFALIFFIAAYIIAVVKFDYKTSALAGLAYLMLSMGSVANLIANIVLASYVIIQVLTMWYRGVNFKDFVKVNSVLFAFVIFTQILTLAYQGIYFISASSYVVIGAFIAIIALYFIKEKLNIPEGTKVKDNRIVLMQAVAIIAILFLFMIPQFQERVQGIGRTMLSVATYRDSLDRTIAEQGGLGEEMYNELGIIGKDLFPAILISPMNLLFKIIDFGSSIVFNLTISTSNKSGMIALLGLMLASIVLAWKFIIDKTSVVELLLILSMLSVSYVGANKAKYTLFLGIMALIAIPIFVGWLYSFLCKYAKYQKTLLAVLICGLFILSTSELIFRDDNVAEALIMKANKQVPEDADINISSCIDSQASDPIDQYDQIAVQVKCARLAPYWMQTMAWLKNNTPEGSRITSWWDYGHWINYFGDRNAVIRNDHVSQEMIGNVGYAFVMGTPQELAAFMKDHDSDYVLFDRELVLNNDGSFGGKFGALNYLGCSWANQTDVSKQPGTSACEQQNRVELIYVPMSNQIQCTIDENTQLTGVTSYSEQVNDKGIGSLKEEYCVTDMPIQDGSVIQLAYYLNKNTPLGGLYLKKALLRPEGQLAQGYQVFSVLYTKELMWSENGTAVSGWTDDKKRFYESPLYQGYFTNQLDGFEIVYATPDNAVKIYKRLE